MQSVTDPLHHRLLLALPLAVLAFGCTDDDDPVGPDAGDYAACSVPSDCLVVPASCCGSCGAPTRGDAIAVARDRAGAYRSGACDDDQGCPACAPLFLDPTLVATCRDQRCELIDLHDHEASACEADDDCRVRTPDCCPCGGDTEPGRLLGVSSESDYASLVCDPDQACPECAPVYPSEVTVRCAAARYCETYDARLPGGGGGGGGGSAGTDGGAPDGGRPDSCSLPPESGPCEAYFLRYHFDASAGRCSLFVYGGCEGNDNNFETAQDCAEACDAPPLPLAACEVDGVVYPSGSTGIGDPLSCNTCSCTDGDVNACTEAGCPEPCPDGTVFGMDCARCGPVDNCEIVRTGCLQACEDGADCERGSCSGGVCLERCG